MCAEVKIGWAMRRRRDYKACITCTACRAHRALHSLSGSQTVQLQHCSPQCCFHRTEELLVMIGRAHREHTLSSL